MRWLSWALCCCLLIIAALLRKRDGTLAELRLAAQPARTPTKFLVLMMKGQPPWRAHALTSPESRGAAVAAARTDGAGFSCDVDRCHTP